MKQIIPSKNTNYWIYVMNQQMHNDYIKNSNKNYISHDKKYIIKKNDIIFIYIKRKENRGFTGVLKVSNNQILNNKKIKIFSNIKINKYVAKLDCVNLFDDIVKLPDVINTFKDNINGHKNIKSFNAKYVLQASGIHEFHTKGDKLLNKLNDLLKIKYNNNKQNNQDSDDSENSDGSENSDDSEDSDDDNEGEGSSLGSDESEEEKDGEIPILMTLCDKFKWPQKKENKLLYFKKHYKYCKKCNRNDNNEGINLSTYLERIPIEIVTMEYKDEEEIERTLKCYWKSKRHDPEEEEESKIRVIRMEEHEIYDDSVLIEWKIKKL